MLLAWRTCRVRVGAFVIGLSVATKGATVVGSPVGPCLGQCDVSLLHI